MLQFMGSQKVKLDLVTEQQQTKNNHNVVINIINMEL